jgi:hypothetical protein
MPKAKGGEVEPVDRVEQLAADSAALRWCCYTPSAPGGREVVNHDADVLHPLDNP